VLELLLRASPAVLGVETGELRRAENWLLRHRSDWFQAHGYVNHRLRADQSFSNARGLAGVLPPLERTPGVPRVVLLGGSARAQGGESGLGAGLGEHLRSALEVHAAGPVEVVDACLPGWSSVEALVWWSLEGLDWRADAVVIHPAYVDAMASEASGTGRDYRGWRSPWKQPRLSLPERELVYRSRLYAWLRARVVERGLLAGMRAAPLSTAQLAPEAMLTEPLAQRNARSLSELAELAGAQCVLMTLPHSEDALAAQDAEARALLPAVERLNGQLRELADARGLLLVDAAAQFTQEADHATLEHGLLRTAAGQERLAQLLAEALSEQVWMRP